MDKSLIPSLDWLRTFEAAARHESFSEAADEVGLTQAAVSQQIRKLEGHLNSTLFRRLPRGVELSAQGDAYLRYVRTALGVISDGTENLFGNIQAHYITIAVPASFSILWLAPRLKRLQESLPHTGISITTIHRPADYEAINADIEIRFGVGDWTGHASEHLFHEELCPMAAPSLIQPEDNPSASWRTLPRISVNGLRQGWSEWFASALENPTSSSTTELWFDSYVTAQEAAKYGMGVILGSLPLCSLAITQKQLVRLSESSLKSDHSYWIVHPANRPMGRNIKNLSNALHDLINAP